MGWLNLNRKMQVSIRTIIFAAALLNLGCGSKFQHIMQFFMEQNPHQGGLDLKSDQVKTEDLVVGTGGILQNSAKIRVNFRTWLFASTHTENKGPLVQDLNNFEAQWGQGQLIEAWEIGLKGMKVGGKRRLLIPASLAYGEMGAGEKIPPNSDLISEIELLQIY